MVPGPPMFGTILVSAGSSRLSTRGRVISHSVVQDHTHVFKLTLGGYTNTSYVTGKIFVVIYV